MTRRVFVVNEPLMWDNGELTRALDLRPARDYGELVHVLPAGKLPSDIRAVADQIKQEMRTYTAEDVILLIGDPRAMAIAAAIAAHVGRGSFSMLHWQKRQRTYDCIVVSGLYDAATRVA